MPELTPEIQRAAIPALEALLKKPVEDAENPRWIIKWALGEATKAGTTVTPAVDP